MRSSSLWLPSWSAKQRVLLPIEVACNGLRKYKINHWTRATYQDYVRKFDWITHKSSSIMKEIDPTVVIIFLERHLCTKLC
jgi:hypothetical protein